MTNFIPIFPLGIVVFPGEMLNLHIFEPRYKQLIKDCFEGNKVFGIPTVYSGEVKEMGTVVRILKITTEYEDGTMDIETEGTEVFKILEIIKELPDKLYSGAIVTYPANERSGGSPEIMKLIISGMLAIFKQMKIKKDFGKPENEIRSYDVAHHVGMSIEEEYLLLELMKEIYRQEYLKRHLARVLPVMAEMESLKKKIKLNGHYKNLEGFKFS